MEIKYFKYFLNMFMIAFVFLTVINSAFTQLNYNFIKLLSDLLKNKLNLCFDLEKTFYLLAGIFIIIIVFKRDTWLPFLGENVLPSVLVPLKKLDGDTIIKIIVKPNIKVAYWATEPKLKNNDTDPDVITAYDKYLNSGVVMSDDNGIAILTLNKGSGYYVPSGKHINSHVHYRELTDDYAMMGPIKTHYF